MGFERWAFEKGGGGDSRDLRLICGLQVRAGKHHSLSRSWARSSYYGLWSCRTMCIMAIDVAVSKAFDSKVLIKQWGVSSALDIGIGIGRSSRHCWADMKK